MPTNTAEPDTQPNASTISVEDVVSRIGEMSDEQIAEAKALVQDATQTLRDKRGNGERLTDEERSNLRAYNEWHTKLDAAEGERAAQDAADDEMLGASPEATTRDAAGEPDEAEETDEEGSEGETPDDLANQAPADNGGSQAMAASGASATTSGTSAVPRLPLGDIKPKGNPSQGSQAAADKSKASLVAAVGSSKPRDTEINEAELGRDIERAIRVNQFGGHGQVIVASVFTDRNDTHHLSENWNPDANARVIETQQGSDGSALVAAGGLIAPFQVDYSVDTIGSSERPVQGAFPHYTADRGGVQIRRDIDAFGGTAVNASGTWTLANDADADNATPKPIWDVPTLDVIQAQVRAVTQGVRLSNITARFDPEGTAAQLRTVDITHARYAEKLLLQDMYSQCTAQMANAGSPLGFTRDLLVAFDRSCAYARENHRLGTQTPTLRTLLPVWVKDLIRADMARAMHTSNAEWLALTDAAINAMFSNRKVNVTWILDGRGAQSGSGSTTTAIPATPAQEYARITTNRSTVIGFPGQLEFPLFTEGTFVYLDGGQLDVGIIRDQNLVQKNRYIMFEETFEGLYRKGIEAIRVVQEVLSPRGGSVGAIAPADIANY